MKHILSHDLDLDFLRIWSTLLLTGVHLFNQNRVELHRRAALALLKTLLKER